MQFEDATPAPPAAAFDGAPPAPPSEGIPDQFQIPLAGQRTTGPMQITSEDGLVTLVVRDQPLSAVLGHIAEQQGLNIVAAQEINARISITLHDVSLNDALDAILAVSGYTWIRQKNIIVVTPIAAGTPISPSLQGRQVRVIPLSFASATDVERIVTGLLSPVGRVVVTQAATGAAGSSGSTSALRGMQENVILEDLPEYLDRIESCIYQIDRPPRQVLVEAHILQVELENGLDNGINFEYISQLAGTDLNLRTVGLASQSASPSFLLGLDGSEVGSLLAAIQSTTDAKTLASPKILALNGQTSEIQIGEKLGYLTTTTTETSTLQDVNFLEVGVVLSLTPTISEGNQVMLSVKPKVSDGQINSTTGLPEEQTTEVETKVLLESGQAMVIGGLIQETHGYDQNKIPLLGDIWILGRLFLNEEAVRRRNEIIVVLVPRILPYDCDYAMRHDVEIDRATTRLFEGPLQPMYRPWEPRLPDAVRNPRIWNPRRAWGSWKNLTEPYPNTPPYYYPAADEQNGQPIPPGVQTGGIMEMGAVPAGYEVPVGVAYPEPAPTPVSR